MKKIPMGRRSGKTSLKAVEQYWSRRQKSTDELSAVLSYDAPPAANRAYDRWEREWLGRLLPRSLRGAQALDIGCGTGRIALLLAQRGATVTGLDLSPAMLNRCRGRATRLKLKFPINVVQAAADRLPFADRSFDIVTCFGLLEHLPPAPRRACLTEVARVLVSGGQVYAVVNNKDNPLLRRQSPVSRSRPGHYVTLVGLDWLRQACSRLGLNMTVQAANPFYGLAQHFVRANRRRPGLSDRRLAAIFRQCGELDLSCPLGPPELLRVAVHFLVRISR